MTTPIIIDIETAPLSEEVLANRMPEFKADSRLKDPDKIAQDIATKRANWMQKSALSAYTGWICAIAVGSMDSDEVFVKTAKTQDDEKALLQWIWSRIADDRGVIVRDVIGHNIRNFDMPFILARSRINKVPVSLTAYTSFRGGVSLSEYFKDTMLYAGFGQYNYTISLDTLSKSLGLTGKNGDGAEFYSKLLENEEEAKQYVINDIILTRECAKILGM
jgi:DNA polymerase elongation subunit (family B)